MSKFGKSDYSEKRERGGRQKTFGTGKEQGKDVNENSEVLKSFRRYAAELDKKHDRYERIVKLSRDVTIESKRIIFLLHSIDRGREEKQVIQEAEKRLDHLVREPLFQIAKELQAQDPYMFHRAFTFGLQEFIEAYTFFHHLKEKTLKHWDYYQNLLKYNLKDETSDKSEGSEQRVNELITTLPPMDYILGIADLSGELMRKCISNLSIGDINGCFETCEVVRKLYAGFLSIGSYKTKELPEKTYTLRQSLLKMEKACYNINVRSKELPEHMFIHLVSEFDGPEKEY